MRTSTSGDAEPERVELVAQDPATIEALELARKAAAEASLALAERNYQRSIIRAPTAGAITQRMVAAGQWADVGAPLLELAVGDKVKVAAHVPAGWPAKELPGRRETPTGPEGVVGRPERGG